MGTVMQRRTHKPIAAPRFFVNGRGVLMDRQATGPARRTGFSMENNDATRSEMQILADLLNEPGQAAVFDAGLTLYQEWVRRSERHDADLRRAVTLFTEDRRAA